jgi:hypothetical protein
MKRNLDSLVLGFDSKPLKDGAPTYQYLTDGKGEVVYGSNGPLLLIDGSTSKPVVKEEAKDMTMGGIAFAIVRNLTEADDKASGDVKLARFKLADKIMKGGVADLDTGDVTMLKARADKVLQDIVMYARFVEWLEADPEPAPA